jgi:tetratricopeptide (TPR) repeat protein
MLKAQSKKTDKLRNLKAEQRKNPICQNKVATDKKQLTTDSQQATTKPLRGFLARCVITAILIGLGGWLLNHNWQLRRIRYENYSFTAEEAEKLKKFPDAQYAYGMRAWSRGDAEKASGFFQQVVSEDPFHMDAWLRLAESEAALGHPEKSRKILMFADDLASGVYRWQWPQLSVGLSQTDPGHPAPARSSFRRQYGSCGGCAPSWKSSTLFKMADALGKGG